MRRRRDEGIVYRGCHRDIVRLTLNSHARHLRILLNDKNYTRGILNSIVGRCRIPTRLTNTETKCRDGYGTKVQRSFTAIAVGTCPSVNVLHGWYH